MTERETVRDLVEKLAEKLPQDIGKEQRKQDTRQDTRLDAVSGQLERIGDILESFLKLQLVHHEINPRELEEITWTDEDQKAVPEILTAPEHEIAAEIIKEREREEKGFIEDEATGEWAEEGDTRR